MSRHEDRPDDAPAMEPWLWTAFAALVPAALTGAVEHSYRIACVAVAGALLVAAIAMLVAQTNRRRRAEAGAEPAATAEQ